MRLKLRYVWRMTDKPVTTCIVSVYEKPHWHTVLTTRDKAEATCLVVS